jgi:hypothetical protein
MQALMQRVALVVALLCAGTSGLLAQAPATVFSRDILVHAHHLAFHIMPEHLPVLVLDAGGLSRKEHLFRR